MISASCDNTAILAQAILAQAISVQVTSCFSGVCQFGLVSLLFRKTSSDAAQRLDDDGSPGLVASIDQGPRPKSEKWPPKAPQKPAPAVRQTGGRQSHNPVPKKGKGKGQSKGAGPPVQSPVVPKPNLNPDEQLKAAQARVVKLEAAIVAIDPAATGLKEALAKARVQAQLRPVQDRIAHTEAFLERSRKKMEALSAEVSRIQEVMAELRAKIQDGVNRLEVLQTEAKAQASPFTVPTNPQEEIRLLRARIAQMDGSAENDIQEGASKRSKMCATSSVDQVPSCASRLRLAEDFVPMCDEDVERWMQDRQADTQEATLAGNPHEVAGLCHVMGTAAHELVDSHHAAFPRCPTQSSDEDGSDVGLSWSQSRGSVDTQALQSPARAGCWRGQRRWTSHLTKSFWCGRIVAGMWWRGGVSKRGFRRQFLQHRCHWHSETVAS